MRIIAISGAATLASFCPFFEAGKNDDEVRAWINKEYAEEIAFLRSLPYYIEDGEHIFVHAGINPLYENWKETSPHDFRWIRQSFLNAPHSHTETFVFGHTRSSILHEQPENFDVWFSDKKIGGIDGGAKFGGQLNALIIENGHYRTYAIPVV